MWPLDVNFPTPNEYKFCELECMYESKLNCEQVNLLIVFFGGGVPQCFTMAGYLNRRTCLLLQNRPERILGT
jgi:hypothetical protein